MGLLLLSLFLSGSLPAWHGGDPGHRPAGDSATWVLGAGDARPSSLPPQTPRAWEHPAPSLWAAVRGARSVSAETPRPAVAHPGADGIRRPQQFAHRAAGSRSPPLV
jgi:hypothetical protein